MVNDHFVSYVVVVIFFLPGISLSNLISQVQKGVQNDLSLKIDRTDMCSEQGRD